MWLGEGHRARRPDGRIPESVAIGISLVGGGAVAAPMVLAVLLSHVPESLSAATGLTKAGHSRRYVLGLWTAVMAASGLAAALGFQFLGALSNDVVAAIQAFAAGAILTMLADTMMPEAFDHGGSAVGLITVLSFSLALFLSATG
jgi:zinc transporter, ZIP family